MNRIVESLLAEIKDELSLADSENKRIERYVKRAYIIIKNYLKNEELTLEEAQEKYPEAILLIVAKKNKPFGLFILLLQNFIKAIIKIPIKHFFVQTFLFR